MNRKEISQNNNGNNVVEMVALYMERRVKKEELSPENQAMLEFYVGIIPDDKKFAAVIDKRRKELISTDGQKTTLFPQETINNISKKKRKRKPEIRGYQPSLWPDEEKRSDFIGGMEPEDKVMALGKELNGRFFRNNRLISEDIKYKKEALRNEIGLPIARGKDFHVKDMFYKYLVNNICNWDRFGIFNENDRSLVERDENLEMKIGEVKGLIGNLLDDKNISRQERFRRFNDFLEEYKRRWEELT